MFRKIFESVPPPYRSVDELGGLPSFIYNPYLLEPPRLYAEELVLLAGLYVRREQTATSNHTIRSI